MRWWLGLVLIGVLSSVPPAAAQSELPGETVELGGLSFRRYAAGATPLLQVEGIPSEVGTWALAAMQRAWEQVPGLTGLPLPTEEVPLFLFLDRAQLTSQTQQLVGAVPGLERATCYGRTSPPGRAIYCDTGRLLSREALLHAIAHELTHQVVRGDRQRARALPLWYEEGLAEYVGSTLLTRDRPTCGAWAWTQREQRVADARREGRTRPLSEFTIAAELQQATDGPLAYAQSALAVRWLVDHFGLEAVITVVRATDTPPTFSTAFQQAFGFTLTDFEPLAAAAVRAPVQRPASSRVEPPPCAI